MRSLKNFIIQLWNHSEGIKMRLTFELLEDITKESKQLLSLAEDSKWDEFSSLNDKRQSALRNVDFINIDLSEQDSSKIHKQMSKLISLNNKLESICVEERDTIAGELKNMRKNAKVAHAYSQ